MGLKDTLFGGGKQKSSSSTNTTSKEDSLVNSLNTSTANSQNTQSQNAVTGSTGFGFTGNTGTSTGTSGSGGTFNQQGWNPVMQRLEGSVLPRVDQFNRQFGGGQGIYQGSRLAPEDALVAQSQNQLLQAAGTYADRSTNLNNTIQGFLNYDPNSPQNQAARDALRANVQNQFNTSIRPGIEDMGTFSGQYGGNQQSIALGAATEPLSRAMADAEVNLMNADRDRAMQAAGMAPSAMGTGFTQGAMTGNIGDQRSARAQLGLEDKMQIFEAPRNAKLRSILEMQGLLSPLASLATSGSNTQAGYNNQANNNSGVSSTNNTGFANQTGTSNTTATGTNTGQVQATATGNMTSNTQGTTQGGGGNLLQAVLGAGATYLGSGGDFGSLLGLGKNSGGLFGEGSTSNVYSGNF